VTHNRQQIAENTRVKKRSGRTRVRSDGIADLGSTVRLLQRSTKYNNGRERDQIDSKISITPLEIAQSKAELLTRRSVHFSKGNSHFSQTEPLLRGRNEAVARWRPALVTRW
jgi:hypothetical protein